MQHRAGAGGPKNPGDYFVEFPELANDVESWRLLSEAREELEERDGHRWLEAWRGVAPAAYHRLAGHEGPTTPDKNAVGPVDLRRLKAGDQLLGFEVTGYLGKGSCGRVYRALDRSLQRQVALKIGEAKGSEGRALARLDHPNIVPVYGEHVIRGSRVLVMRYLPGGSLAEWVSVCHGGEGAEPGAKPIRYQPWSRNAAAAGGDQPAEGDATPEDAPSPPAYGSNAEVAAWIVWQLALALQHAHRRGVLHLDIKPANVLIDASGAPLLSDFNVAVFIGEGGTGLVGGTLNYMSPEQLRAYCGEEAAAASLIDTRSDTYALGVVLLELLTGSKSWTRVGSAESDAAARRLLASRLRSGPPSIAGLAGVNHSLAAIVDKALSPAAEARYQSAADLATDLKRWLGGRPNTHAANPNRRERVGRWLRRRRGAVSATLAGALAAGLAANAWINNERGDLVACDRLLTEAARSLEEGDSPKAAERLGRAQADYRRLVTTPWLARTRHTAVGRRLDETAKLVRDHEASRFVSLVGRANLQTIHVGGPTDGADLIEDGLRVYGALTRSDWQQQEPYAGLPAAKKTIVTENITELLLISIIKSIESSRPPDRQWEAVLSRVPAEHRSHDVFAALRSQPPGRARMPEVDPPNDPFACYLWGVVATANSDTQTAYRCFSRALKLRSRGETERFWLRYRLGITCQQLGRHTEACVHYGACLGLRPDFAWPHFNLGLACYGADDLDHAVNHLRQAIRLDPQLTAAYIALGKIEIDRGDHVAALETCKAAEQAGLSSDELSALRKRLAAGPP